jgi:allophanate hydrolase
VSIFSLNVDDAMIALNVMAGYDATDPYSRDRFVGR